MVGGLIQLVAYGGQDVFLTGTSSIETWSVKYGRYSSFDGEFVYDKTTNYECMNIKVMPTKRVYKNFVINQIQWSDWSESKYGTSFFTVDKYKELKEKYSNMEYVNMNMHNMLELNITKGNVEIKRKLKKIIEKCRKFDKKDSELNDKSNKSITPEITSWKIIQKDNKKTKGVPPRHHKKFFYGK